MYRLGFSVLGLLVTLFGMSQVSAQEAAVPGLTEEQRQEIRQAQRERIQQARQERHAKIRARAAALIMEKSAARKP